MRAVLKAQMMRAGIYRPGACKDAAQPELRIPLYSASYTHSRCSRPMCGVAAGLPRPSKHLIRFAFTMRSSPHNVGHHESRFPSLGINASIL